MDDGSLRLDGNALAGALEEIFAGDVTAPAAGAHTAGA